MEALLEDITETTGLYYYLTMKDFERGEGRKVKKKSQKLSTQEKQMLHNQLKDRLDEIFSITSLKKSIAPKKVRINNYEQLFDFFSQSNMFEFVNGVKLLDTYFKCSILDGNFAWISKDERGHFRYFSKNTNHVVFGFDLIDLLEIYYGVPATETIERAVKELKINFMEDIWARNQNEKYLSNLTVIHGAKKIIGNDFPFLFNCLDGQLKVLETINVIANINIKKQEFSYLGHNIFFASNSYIANFLNDYPLSTTNKVINLFAVLGLIQKIKEDDIPSTLLHESKMIADNRNLGNIISYYIVPPILDVLAEANYRAEVLSKNGISYSNINRAKIAFVFGEEFANNIYVQNIQKNKIRKSNIPKHIHKLLEDNLLKILDSKGFATKKMIAKKRLGKTTIKDREKELNKIWKALVLKHQLKYIKPNEEMKLKFGLKTNEYILMR